MHLLYVLTNSLLWQGSTSANPPNPISPQRILRCLKCIWLSLGLSKKYKYKWHYKVKNKKQFPQTTIPLHRLLKFFECNCLSVFQTCNDTKQTRFRKLQTFSLLTNWQIGYKWPLTHNVSPFFQLRKYSTLNRDNFYLFHIHRERNCLSFEKCKKNKDTMKPK